MPEPINDLTRLEHDLHRLSPAPAQLDRDNLFHTAGKIQGERRLFFWKATSLTLAVAVIVLAAGLIFRPERLEQRVIAVAVPVNLPAATQPGAAPVNASPDSSNSEESIPLFDREPGVRPNGMSYQEMRSRGLRYGPEGLTGSPPQPISTEVPRNRPVEDDLNLPRETLKEWNSSQRAH